MDAKELHSAIMKNPAALAAAKAGTNGLLLEALGPGYETVSGELLNEALLLIHDSHLSRYMRDEFVDPVTHQRYLAAEAAAYESVPGKPGAWRERAGARAEANASNTARVRAGTYGLKVEEVPHGQ